MSRLPLEEFIAKKGQSEAAKCLGVTPPALSKALTAARSIFVIEHDDGSFSAEELRPFPSQPARHQAA